MKASEVTFKTRVFCLDNGQGHKDNAVSVPVQCQDKLTVGAISVKGRWLVDILKRYRDKYIENLTQEVIPFWIKHSPDFECGGYFTCLERDGSVYDDKKYLWLQSRQVWMFSRLYNELEKKQQYLELATLGLEFIEKYGKDEKNRLYFSLTREGEPFFYQRKPYAAVFYMLALLEYSRATGENKYLEQAREMFRTILHWIDTPSLMGRDDLKGCPATSNLADVMVIASMAVELIKVDKSPEYLQVIEETLNTVKLHYNKKHKILIENISKDNCDFSKWPERRLFNPGHSIEAAWFIFYLLDWTDDPEAETMALNVIENSLAFGWDKEYGGLYYFMDIDAKPTLQLESTMKLWWPHTEAIYALILAYSRTTDKKWLDWLEKVDEYSFSHFVDKEHGGWFGYCDRQGNLTHTCKGGNYKGFFHVPRALLYSFQELDRLTAQGKPTVLRRETHNQLPL